MRQQIYRTARAEANAGARRAEKPIPSSRPQAKLEHLREMGEVLLSGDIAVCTTRTRERTEWRRQSGSAWYERVDQAAPIAPTGSVAHGDPREEPTAFEFDGRERGS